MSWLSKLTGIHVNLRPLAAPAGAVLGGLLGGPGGAALGAGLFKTGDNKAHGDSWGHALGQGALNAGLAYGAAGGLSQLKNAFAPSSSASINALPAAGGSAAGSVASDPMAEILKRGVPGMQMTGAAPAASGGGGFLSGLGKAATGVAHFAKDNSMATGMGLQGLGHIATAGADNAYRHAQTNSLNIQNQMSEEEMARRKRLAEAFGPLQQALMAQMSGMSKGYNIAPDPYDGGQ